MHVINVRNVHDALPEGLIYLRDYGIELKSRNGKVKTSPGPVTTVYSNPTERVLFWPQRDANPFFHLFESLWMLLGRNDVDGVSYYASNMKTYSDNGSVLWGAYGWRWRKYFGYDQLEQCIKQLDENPNDRRVVLGMWDPREDLIKGASGGLDVPCNMIAHFRVINEKLCMTVFCRSNDIVWGAYGANAVHFSMLQEYIAASLGRECGYYAQVSDDFHIYEPHFELIRTIGIHCVAPPYTQPSSPYPGSPPPVPLMSVPKAQWDMELQAVINENSKIAATDPFLSGVVIPMLCAFKHYKKNRGQDRYIGAKEIASQITSWDWKAVAYQWIDLRFSKWLAKADDGVSYE